MGTTIPKKLEDFARKHVPLLRTYLQREETRDIDKIVRDELVKKIGDLIKQFNDAKQTLVDQGVLQGLDLLDRSSSRLQKIANNIQFAARGYSGVFDKEQMAGDQLNRLVEFDTNLFDLIEALATGLKDALSKPQDALKASLAGFDQQVKDFEAQLSQRDSYARERTTGK
jgi:hypothetical protein